MTPVAPLRPLLLILAALAVSAGCGSEPAGSATRTLKDFEPHLTATLTPTMAVEKFGKPDSEIRADKWVFIYRLAERRRLLLSFPGEAPIIFARVEDAGGLATELPLRK